MVEKISVQIALEGTEEIKRQLAGVSEAGQKAFADISAAAAKAGGFDRLDPTLVAQKFNQFGITASADINKITAALQAAGKTEALVTGVQRMEQGVGRLGNAASKATEAFGLTRRELGALDRALRAVDLGPLGSQLGLLGRVGLAFGPVGIGITAIGVAIAGVTASLAKFASAAEQTEKALTELQKVSGISFQSLSALQQVFAAGGTNAEKFASEFGNLTEKIAEAGIQEKTRHASKDAVEWANNVRNVAGQFDVLAAGFRTTFSPLTTLDTKVKALLESLSKARTPAEQWLKLADIFKSLSSDLDRVQLGKALGLSPESITTLSQTSAAIQRLHIEAQQLGLTLTAGNQQALQTMAEQWNQFTALLSAFFQKIGAEAAPAFGQLLASFRPVMQQIVSDFQDLPLDQAIANLGDRLAPAFNAITELLSPIFVQMGNALGTAFVTAVSDAVKGAISQIFANFGQELLTNWQILLENLRRLGRHFAPEPGSPAERLFGGGDGLPMASGGLIGGRGTGTSDSNLAWVSRGEHIMPARAVMQPGVLAFLEALRRSGGNLRGLLDGMGHFAHGGIVPRSALAFAQGGPVGSSSGRILNLTIEGRSFIGLSIPESTAQSLERFAVYSQIASTGRKPSWRR
jgi:hypothetical protein